MSRIDVDRIITAREAIFDSGHEYRKRLVEAMLVFQKNHGRSDRWLSIMGSAGEELTTLGRIYCNATRLPGEGDDALRVRCFENWRDDADAGEDLAQESAAEEN